jgi:hypothetical protein
MTTVNLRRTALATALIAATVRLTGTGVGDG